MNTPETVAQRVEELATQFSDGLMFGDGIVKWRITQALTILHKELSDSFVKAVDLMSKLVDEEELADLRTQHAKEKAELERKLAEAKAEKQIVLDRLDDAIANQFKQDNKNALTIEVLQKCGAEVSAQLLSTQIANRRLREAGQKLVDALSGRIHSQPAILYHHQLKEALSAPSDEQLIDRVVWEAVEELSKSQELTIGQVLKQAIRLYQLHVKGDPIRDLKGAANE